MSYSRRRRNRTGKIALKARLAKVSISGVVTAKPNRNVTGRAALASRKAAVSAAGSRSAPKRTGTSALQLKLPQFQASGVITTTPSGTEFSAEFSTEFGISGSIPGAVSGIVALRMAMARELATGTVTPGQIARSFTAEYANEFY